MWLAFLLPNPDTLPKNPKSYHSPSNSTVHDLVSLQPLWSITKQPPNSECSLSMMDIHTVETAPETLVRTFLLHSCLWGFQIAVFNTTWKVHHTKTKLALFLLPATLQSSKYSPTCATETKREKSTKTFTSAINAAWKKSKIVSQFHSQQPGKRQIVVYMCINHATSLWTDVECKGWTGHCGTAGPDLAVHDEEEFQTALHLSDKFS